MTFLERFLGIVTPDNPEPDVSLLANLDPGSELDSIIRDFFTRMIRKASEQGKVVTLDLSEPNPGHINWNVAEVGGKPVVSIWWVPE